MQVVLYLDAQRARNWDLGGGGQALDRTTAESACPIDTHASMPQPQVQLGS